MFEKIFEMTANGIDTFGEIVAKFGSLKRKVVLTPHKIKHEYISPPEDKEKLAWDEEMYVNGNVFPSNKANPVKLDTESGEWISSQRYKEYMKNDLVESLIKTTEREGIDITTALKLMLGLLIANFAMTMYLMMNFLGVL